MQPTFTAVGKVKQVHHCYPDNLGKNVRARDNVFNGIENVATLKYGMTSG